MNDLEKEIVDALDEEDRALFESYGEQGLYAQWFSVYRGKQAWTAIMSTIAMLILFAGAFYCGSRFMNAQDSVEALRWAGASGFLMLMVAFMKVWFWMRMESNRILREVKRVELQVARLQAK